MELIKRSPFSILVDALSFAIWTTQYYFHLSTKPCYRSINCRNIANNAGNFRSRRLNQIALWFNRLTDSDQSYFFFHARSEQNNLTTIKVSWKIILICFLEEFIDMVHICILQTLRMDIARNIFSSCEFCDCNRNNRSRKLHRLQRKWKRFESLNRL